jgi:nucleoside-diphosphate-sugar epimerase
VERGRRVLVTGATGALGPSVVLALNNSGFAVRTLSIEKPEPGVFAASVDARVGDVTDAETVRAAMDGIGKVVHLAALLHAPRSTTFSNEDYQRVNVRGTRNLVEAAQTAAVERLVLFSTITVYGRTNGRVVTEDDEPRPETPYAQTKLEAEKVVLGSVRENGSALGTVLRFGAAYGARLKGNYLRLVTALAQGRFVPIGRGKNRRTLVFDADVARSALMALEHPAAAGRLYNVSDGNPHMLREIIEAICGALERRAPRFFIPVWPARVLAALSGAGARLVGGQSPIDRDTIDKYTEDVAVDSRRIQTELGFRPGFDLGLGWRETVRALRISGRL